MDNAEIKAKQKEPARKQALFCLLKGVRQRGEPAQLKSLLLDVFGIYVVCQIKSKTIRRNMSSSPI